MSNCNNAGDIFGLNVISALFLIAGIYPTTNLKTYEQAKDFSNATNTKSSSDESLKEKRQTFIGMCSLFTWFNMQILCHYDIGVFTTLSHI